jgi:regulatory protein
MPKEYQKLLEYALRISSKKRYTVYEMRAKLERFFKKRKFTEEEVMDQVIERLCELRYLDDESFARDFVSQRLKLRPKGQFMLKRELTQKGIDKDLCEKVLEETEIDEDSVACELLEKVMGRWERLPVQKGKEKAYRYLASRGFRQDSIYKSLERCYNPRVSGIN